MTVGHNSSARTSLGRTARRPARASALLAAVLVALLGSLSLQSATAPAQADPDVNTVKKKVDALNRAADQAGERFNAARIQLRDSQERLKGLRRDVKSQQRVVDTMRDRVASLMVRQYQGNSLDTATQVVFSDDSRAFIDNLNAASSYSSQQGQVIDAYRVQLKRLQLRQAAASDQVDALTKTRTVLASAKKTADAKAAAATKTLDSLRAKQRAALLGGDPNVDASAIGASGKAAVAIKYAMAQVGKPYVWGAAGPGSFDCSGLTMAAWGRAGVGLPHSSRAQMGSGRPVAESDLQPGDLVFYYSPVSHVGMYIGNGMIVNAENPSVGVKVTGLHAMPYSGAVRPG